MMQVLEDGMPSKPKTSFLTYKTHHSKVFGKDPILKKAVQDVLNLSDAILHHRTLFATYHVTHELQAGREVEPLDQTYWNRCTSAVTTATDGSEPFDKYGLANPQHSKHDTPAGQQFRILRDSLTQYNAQLPAGHQKLDRPAILKDVSVAMSHPIS